VPFYSKIPMDDEDLIDFMLRVKASRALAVRAMVEDWTKLQAAHAVLMEHRSETTAPLFTRESQLAEWTSVEREARALVVRSQP